MNDNRMDLADLLTCSRFVLATGAAVSLWISPDSFTVPLLLSFAVYVTDFLDGRVARAQTGGTAKGAVLDALADFYYIFLMHMIIALQGFLPIWYPVLILWKFLEFGATSWTNSQKSGHLQAVHDPLGRVLALWFYATPVIIMGVRHFRITVIDIQIQYTVAAIFLWTIASSALRILHISSDRRRI